MKILENQTLYQCEHCGKRLLSKNGAKLHEEQYCRVIRELERKEMQNICTHNNTDTHYELIPGEDYVKEPAYQYCIDCGKIL